MDKSYHKEENNACEEDILKGLKDFFDHHSLKESRNTLWKWLNVSGSGGFHTLELKEREDLLNFYTHLQGLLEVTHKMKVSFDNDDNLKQK